MLPSQIFKQALLLPLLGAVAAAAPRELILDNDWSESPMPLLIALAANSSLVSNLTVTSVSGNTWGNQCLAYAQRYLQAALSSAANATDELASRTEAVGAVPGALLPLLRTQQGYEQGLNYTGALSFAGSWRPYNQTAESMGQDPTGNEADAGRVTFQGEAAPRALTGQLASSAALWAPDVLVERSKAARARNETVTLVAIGPLTNLALALARDADFAQGVELFYQGGYLSYDLESLLSVRNSDIFNDFNTIFDPQAAKRVLRAPFKRLVLINEAASRVTPPEDVVAAAGNTSAGASSEQRFLGQLIGAPAEPGLPLWDELAVLAALYPEVIANSTVGRIDIDDREGGWSYGRAFAWRDELAPAGLQQAEIVTSFDEQRVHELYVAAAQAFVNP